MIWPVERLLVVSHRPIDQAGGPAARWRSFSRHLPEHGWEVDVVSAGGGDEFAAPERARRRARIMETAGKVADPIFRLAGLRPEAMPLSMLWVRGGTKEIRSRLAAGRYDAVLATGPPFAAVIAARRVGGDVPLVVELRDLWAGNPAFDRGGPVLRKLESWVVGGSAAVIGVTPEAAVDLRERHPAARETRPQSPRRSTSTSRSASPCSRSRTAAPRRRCCTGSARISSQRDSTTAHRSRPRSAGSRRVACRSRYPRRS
jgi:hypothetical protein